jgi:hypothetical protein
MACWWREGEKRLISLSRAVWKLFLLSWGGGGGLREYWNYNWLLWFAEQYRSDEADQTER